MVGVGARQAAGLNISTMVPALFTSQPSLGCEEENVVGIRGQRSNCGRRRYRQEVK